MTADASPASASTGLADLGIDVPKATGGARPRTPRSASSTIDEAKLTTALDADPTKVRDLFAGVGATKGISHADRRLRRHADRHQRLDQRPHDGRRHRAEGPHRPDRPAERRASTSKREAPQGAVRGHGDRAAVQTQQAWLTGQIASLPRSAKPQDPSLAPITEAIRSVLDPGASVGHLRRSRPPPTSSRASSPRRPSGSWSCSTTAPALPLPGRRRDARGRPRPPRTAAPRRGDHRRAHRHARP